MDIITAKENYANYWKEVTSTENVGKWFTNNLHNKIEHSSKNGLTETVILCTSLPKWLSHYLIYSKKDDGVQQAFDHLEKLIIDAGFKIKTDGIGSHKKFIVYWEK